jgi:hypothetical protein
MEIMNQFTVGVLLIAKVFQQESTRSISGPTVIKVDFSVCFMICARRAGGERFMADCQRQNHLHEKVIYKMT